MNSDTDATRTEGDTTLTGLWDLVAAIVLAVVAFDSVYGTQFVVKWWSRYLPPGLVELAVPLVSIAGFFFLMFLLNRDHGDGPMLITSEDRSDDDD